MSRHVALIGLSLILAGCTTATDPTAAEPASTTTTATTTTLPPSTTTTTPPLPAVTFTAAGDVGGHDDPAGTVLRSMAETPGDFTLFLGDLSYGHIEPERAWCEWVQAFFPAQHPIEIVSGNHEEDGSSEGFIRNFIPCLPDRLGAVGDYGVEYYFDVGPVRVIMIAADLSIDGVTYDYAAPGPSRSWLLATLSEAEAAGQWTIVGMHKVCVTSGDKGCEIGEATIDGLINHGADLILQGHDHNYQRSHQLHCIDRDTTTRSCLADTDADFAAGRGAVLAIAGWVGQPGYDVSGDDSEAGYFAVIGGPNSEDWGPGFLTVTATPERLEATWTTVGGGAADSFSIDHTG